MRIKKQTHLVRHYFTDITPADIRCPVQEKRAHARRPVRHGPGGLTVLRMVRHCSGPADSCERIDADLGERRLRPGLSGAGSQLMPERATAGSPAAGAALVSPEAEAAAETGTGPTWRRALSGMSASEGSGL